VSVLLDTSDVTNREDALLEVGTCGLVRIPVILEGSIEGLVPTVEITRFPGREPFAGWGNCEDLEGGQRLADAARMLEPFPRAAA